VSLCVKFVTLCVKFVTLCVKFVAQLLALRGLLSVSSSCQLLALAKSLLEGFIQSRSSEGGGF
jgi:hypothetical protein